MDGISAGQIIELVNQNIKDQRIEIGRIDLMQSFSFFESPKENTDILISSLGRAQINGRKISVEVASDKDNRGEEKRRGSYKGNFSRSDKGDFRSGERKDSRDGQKSYSSNISRSPNKRSASKDGSGESGDWRQFFNSDNNSKGGDKKPKGDNRSFKKRR
jgi:ATP-dependent RNA helicase DeaD